MSDPYAPPGSQRGPESGGDRRRAPSELPPSTAQPHEPQQRRPQDTEGALRASRLGLRFSLLVLAGLVAGLWLDLPWSLGGLVFLLLGLGVGIRALVCAVRARMRASAVVTMSLGLAMASLIVLVMIAQLIFLDASMTRQSCLDDALTDSSRRACEAQFTASTSGMLPTATP